MALRRDLTYPARYDAATPAQPQGGFKNRSAPAVLDGSYLEEGWLNDWSGFFGRLLTKAGFTPNGVGDTALDSQFMDAADFAFYNRVGRNVVMNGDFAVSQRGEVFVPDEFDYTLDRWLFVANLFGGTLTSPTVERKEFPIGQSVVPNNPKYYVDFSGYVAGAAGNLEATRLLESIEGVETLAGEETTISFWVKGNIAGNIGVNVQQSFGVGGGESPATFPLAETIPITTDWTKVVKTFVMDSIAGKTIGATPSRDRLLVSFISNMGAAQAAIFGQPDPILYTGVVSIADVQMEAGTKATDYERLFYGDSLLLCQRYYQDMFFDQLAAILTRGGPGGHGESGNYMYFTRMRTTPSIIREGSGLLSLARLDGNGSVNGILDFAFIPNENGLRIQSSPQGLPEGAFYGTVFLGGARAFISAEF